MSVRLDHGEDELAENHEINVTPFIDVMLVLLIIFMVVAPLATVDVPIDLPASTARPQPHPAKRAIGVVRSRVNGVRSRVNHVLVPDRDPASPEIRGPSPTAYEKK